MAIEVDVLTAGLPAKDLATSGELVADDEDGFLAAQVPATEEVFATKEVSAAEFAVAEEVLAAKEVLASEVPVADEVLAANEMLAAKVAEVPDEVLVVEEDSFPSTGTCTE